MSLKPGLVNFDEIWSRLRQTLESVILLEPVDKKEWNIRFSDVYHICIAIPEPLYEALYAETRKFLMNHVNVLYKQISLIDDGDNLLINYYNRWLVYRDGVHYMDQLFEYLNAHHIRKQKFSDADLSYGCIEFSRQELEIGEMGLYFWQTNMIEPLGDSIVRLLLKTIEDDRFGNPTNESVVQEVILSFVTVESYKKKDYLDLYQTLFEAPFLQATGEYYRKEAERLLRDYDCSTYMDKVLQRLDAENLRSRKYLHPSSYSKVSSECEGRMVADHLNFLHSECQRMVLSENRKDLNNMFKLLKPIESGLAFLIKEIQEHFTRIGLNCINNLSGENIPTTFVESLLQVHRKNLNLINDVFHGDQQFISALDKAFSYIINFRTNEKLPCRSPELLARYCDFLLKKASRGLSEFEIDEKLTSSITIFKYIHDKDVFQKFYAKMLAKRLIHSQSVSMDSEESVVNKLKQACGHEFTSKFHRMLTDIKVSNDLNRSFSDWFKEKGKNLGGVNFNIFVLQAGAWPLTQNVLSPFSIPQILEKSVSTFESFYNHMFNGRKLTFLHHLSTCEVKICFSKKSYFASMGTYYMAILILFDTIDCLSFKEIHESTNIAEDQLVKHLISLIDIKLLLIQNSTNEPLDSPFLTSEESPASFFKMNTMFKLNLNFSNKRTKFKILAINQKESQQQQEVEQTHVSVEEDRKLFLQAAIVRIMKARRVIKHNALIQEVIEQSKNRFAPSVQIVKKSIEALMEKQYLERTANTDEYSYVA